MSEESKGGDAQPPLTVATPAALTHVVVEAMKATLATLPPGIGAIVIVLDDEGAFQMQRTCSATLAVATLARANHVTMQAIA